MHQTAARIDESGWDATTWPVVVTDDGRHFVRVLHFYADASGESHGREALLPTEVAPAPGGDGLPYHKVPNIPFSLGSLGDVPAGFDNSLHTTPSPWFISFAYGDVCLTTSDGISWRMWPNRNSAPDQVDYSILISPLSSARS